MITQGRARNPAPPAGGLLITKIITGLGLALLLIVGAWSGSHRDADASSYLTAVSTASTEVAIASGSVGGSTQGAAGVSAPLVLIDSASDYVVIGLAGCLLGIVCSFLILIVARIFVNHVPTRNREHLPRVPETTTVTGHPFARTLSLTQLSLSRT